MKEAQVILNRLLDKFENSKHLSEPNTSRRRVMLRIDKRELPEYQYEDAAVRDAYNAAARELERQALVRLEWARKQSVLSCIVLDLERVEQCYECADRVHPRKKAEEVANIIMQKLADNPVPWIAAWRDAVCAQVRNSMKVPMYCRENDGLLQELLLTFQRYATLSGSVTMRAFSSQCFHDTKYFERNVRELFLTIARKYNTQLAAACTEAELGERDQLAFLGIYARPELYELSGDCTILLQKGELRLSAAELQQGTEPREALNSFLLFIGKDPLVGHNIAFDLEFLRMTCKRYGFPAPTNRQIDLAQLARRNLTRIANYKLVTLAQHFQLAEKVEHRALPDCRLIQQVYCKLKETAVQ